MKEVTKETVTVTTEYHAVDGTVFTSKEECTRYEESARCVLKTRLKRITVNDQYSLYDLMAGDEDVKIIVVKVSNYEDAGIVLQNILFEQPYLTENKNKNELKEIEDTLYNAAKKSDVVLLGCDAYNNSLWLLDSRQNLIDKLMSLDKKEDGNV